MEQLADVGVIFGIPLAEIQLRRDCQITLLCQATTDILNVFMYAKNFLYHQHHREGAAVICRFGDIGRQIVTL
ncbi:hypothetical protein D3C72_2296280 [compost metagenome]